MVRREDIAASFNPPWSAAEIETATEILSSDYGRKFLRLLDLTQTPTLVKQMSGLSGLSDGAKARMREVQVKAADQYGAAAMDLSFVAKANPAFDRRLAELMARLNQADGERMGAAAIQPAMVRFGRVVHGILPELQELVLEFRKINASTENRL